MDSYNAWLTATAGSLLEKAPENILSGLDHQRVFDSPEIGIVDGRDPIFREFRKVVSSSHFLPDEILARERRSLPRRNEKHFVVSISFPFTPEVRLSNRNREWPSSLYSTARNNGGALCLELARRLADAVRSEGFAATVPALADDYDAFRQPGAVFSSNWSERHIAYAAGLGTFGLNGFLITHRGVMVRFTSLVTDLPLTPTPARPRDHRAPCLADGGAQCGVCTANCPSGAISSEGLDKELCYARRNLIRSRSLDLFAARPGTIPCLMAVSGRKSQGFSLGCAVCVSGAPCECEDPFSITKETPSCSTSN